MPSLSEAGPGRICAQQVSILLMAFEFGTGRKDPVSIQERNGKQVTANELKAALDEACGKDTGRVYVYNVLKSMVGTRKSSGRGIRRQQTKKPARPQKMKTSVLDARSRSGNRTVRLMFVDEAGFGRINKPRRCWCSKG